MVELEERERCVVCTLYWNQHHFEYLLPELLFFNFPISSTDRIINDTEPQIALKFSRIRIFAVAMCKWHCNYEWTPRVVFCSWQRSWLLWTWHFDIHTRREKGLTTVYFSLYSYTLTCQRTRKIVIKSFFFFLSFTYYNLSHGNNTCVHAYRCYYFLLLQIIGFRTTWPFKR